MNIKPEQLYTYKSRFPVRRTQTTSQDLRERMKELAPLWRQLIPEKTNKYCIVAYICYLTQIY